MFIIGTAVLPTPTEAQTLQSYCERHFEFRIYKYTPYTTKKCSLIWEKMSYEWTTGLYSNKN